MRRNKRKYLAWSAVCALAAPTTLFGSCSALSFVNKNACFIFDCNRLFFLGQILDGAADFQAQATAAPGGTEPAADDHDDH